MKVFSVAGFHHTGKTRTTIGLLTELKRRGYSVTSIKDIHNEAFTMEKIGSNSYKHWEASDSVVFARGIGETYQIWHRQLSLGEMLSHLKSDFVVVEGMYSDPLPRIVCAETEAQLAEMVDGTVFAVSGIYADEHTAYESLPVLHNQRDIAALADLVEEKVFEVLPMPALECCARCGGDCRQMVGEILQGRRSREECQTDRQQRLIVELDGEELVIVPFVQETLRDVIRGFLRNLKGYHPGEITIKIPPEE